MRKLCRLTGGIPRLINVLCDRALLGAYVQGKDRVDGATLTEAAGEVFGKGKRSSLMAGRERVLAGVMAVVIGIALSAVYYHLRSARSGDAAGNVDQNRMSAQVPERPRLDTLWWFDRRSFLWEGLKEPEATMRDEDRWTIQGQLRSHVPAGEQVHEQLHDATASGQAPDAAGGRD
jgi:hypothetical protein